MNDFLKRISSRKLIVFVIITLIFIFSEKITAFQFLLSAGVYVFINSVDKLIATMGAIKGIKSELLKLPEDQKDEN